MLTRLLWTTHNRDCLRKGWSPLELQEFLRLAAEPCLYCGEPPYERVHGGVVVGRASGVDRLDNGLGYVEGNVVACCKICNGMKSSMGAEEFLRRCALIATRCA